MFANEGLSPLYRGLPAGLMGIFIFQIMQHFSVEFFLHGHPLTGIALFHGGLAASMPFIVVCTKVQYHKYNSQLALREAHSNSLKTALFIAKTEGVIGFYRGAVPYLLPSYLAMMYLLV